MARQLRPWGCDIIEPVSIASRATSSGQAVAKEVRDVPSPRSPRRRDDVLAAAER